MELKKIERASKYLTRIRELDAEIIEIEKMAIHVASNASKVSLSLAVEKNKEDEKVKFDDDCSIIKNDVHMPYGLSFLLHTGNVGAIPLHSHKIEKSVSEVVTLEILGILINNKIAERAELIKKIEKL